MPWRDDDSDMDLDLDMERDAEMNNSVLYDVLVYNEWNVVKDSSDAQQQKQQHQQQQQQQPGLTQRLWPFKSAPLSSSTGRMAEMRRLDMRWQLAVSSDASLVAVAQDDDILEILARSSGASGPSYVSVSRSELPHDPMPELRRLAWSPDSLFLAVTASNGRVLVYDSRSGGDLAFGLLSNNLPDWDGPACADTSYCFVRFVLEPHDTSSWHSRLILVDNSGRVNVFLCAATGYQELANSSALCQVYPEGVFDVELLPDSSLLYTCGQSAGKSARGITCWRMTEEQEDGNERPFLELVNCHSIC